MRGKVRIDMPSACHNQHPLTLTLSPKGRGNKRKTQSWENKDN